MSAESRPLAQLGAGLLQLPLRRGRQGQPQAERVEGPGDPPADAAARPRHQRRLQCRRQRSPPSMLPLPGISANRKPRHLPCQSERTGSGRHRIVTLQVGRCDRAARIGGPHAVRQRRGSTRSTAADSACAGGACEHRRRGARGIGRSRAEAAGRLGGRVPDAEPGWTRRVHSGDRRWTRPGAMALTSESNRLCEQRRQLTRLRWAQRADRLSVDEDLHLRGRCGLGRSRRGADGRRLSPAAGVG